MTFIVNAIWSVKDYFLPPTPWKMDAYLENYAVITVFEDAMGAYVTSIYHLGMDKKPLTANRVKYRALKKDDARRYHYTALQQALEIETKRRCYTTLKWERCP